MIKQIKTTQDGFSGHVFWKQNLFAFFVSIFDLVHDVDAILNLLQLLTVSGNLF